LQDPLDNPDHSWAYDSAEYRARLEEKFFHPVYKVCSDFHYLDLKCCLSVCHKYHETDLYWIETPGGHPAYVCCAIRKGLDPAAAFKRNQEFFLSKDPEIVEFRRFPSMKGYSHDCPGAIYDID